MSQISEKKNTEFLNNFKSLSIIEDSAYKITESLEDRLETIKY